MSTDAAFTIAPDPATPPPSPRFDHRVSCTTSLVVTYSGQEGARTVHSVAYRDNHRVVEVQREGPAGNYKIVLQSRQGF